MNRRTLLRGAGASLALPLLNAMRPKKAMADEFEGPAPRRFVGMFVPNGIHMPDWIPSATGPDYELPAIMSPLAALKSEFLVLSGLNNEAAIVPVAGDHARGTGTFLTCSPVFKTEGAGIFNGISVDQRIAAGLGKWTQFPSLEIGAEGGASVGNCDSGYSCAYSRNISWSSDTTPVPKEVNPAEVFDRLFGGFDASLSKAQVDRRRLMRLNVVDLVRADAKTLRQKLGQTDRMKLDEFLVGVHELEKRIQAAADAPVCYPGTPPAPALDFPTHVNIMVDMVALAFQCDLTRVVTFMFGNGGSNRIHSHLGVKDEHHYLSHHAGDAAKQANLAVINTWEVSVLAGLMERLKALPEDDGTVLDNSLIYFSSEISDGNSHSHKNLPIILAGRGGGAVTPGRHVAYDGAPVADLFISSMNALGVPADTFGMDGTSPLPNLT